VDQDGHDVGGARAAARLWIPMLAAYTCARIVELAAVRREDCLRDEDGWSIRLDGAQRAARRKVPLHRTIVAAGFPAFVESRPPGLVFAEDESSIPRVAKSAMVGAKLGARELPERFLTATYGADVSGNVTSAILGRPPDYHDRFGFGCPLAVMPEAIERLPEFV